MSSKQSLNLAWVFGSIARSYIDRALGKHRPLDPRQDVSITKSRNNDTTVALDLNLLRTNVCVSKDGECVSGSDRPGMMDDQQPIKRTAQKEPRACEQSYCTRVDACD